MQVRPGILPLVPGGAVTDPVHGLPSTAPTTGNPAMMMRTIETGSAASIPMRNEEELLFSSPGIPFQKEKNDEV